MKHLKNIILFVPFLIFSCASGQYLENYEPVNVFLQTQKIDNKHYILQGDKGANTEALRIFNGGDGPDHIVDPDDPKDYTHGLFVEKHWKGMYNQYAGDTIKKYWKKQDFPLYDFTVEKGTGLTLKHAVLNKYLNTGIENVIIISEPMYYWNKKYIMFYFNTVSFGGSSRAKVIIMKKEDDKWIVVREIGDYIYY